MKTWISIRYAKQVIGGVLAVFALIAAVILYFYFRGPVGSRSPYETVNDLYEWEYMTVEIQQDAYPWDTEKVRIDFRNDAPDGVLVLAWHSSSQWVLEKQVDGKWRSMRATLDRRGFNYPQEDIVMGVGPSDVIKWGGGELAVICDLATCYPWPLESGRYRIVIPECEHMDDVADLAVEFEILAAE